jgi:hypothetical protein
MYYKRFQEEYVAYVAAGGPELDEAVRVAIFNNGVGSTHAGYVASVRNDASRGIRVPQTLESNYMAASKFVTAESGRDGGAEGAAAVYYTGDQRSARDQQRPKRGTSEGDKKKKKTMTCFACGEPGHKIKDCPMLADEVPADRGSKDSEDEEEDADETKVNAAVMPAVSSTSRVPATFLVGIDSGAFTSVFNNRNLLDDVVDYVCKPLRDWHGSKTQNRAQVHSIHSDVRKSISEHRSIYFRNMTLRVDSSSPR